MAKTDIGPKIGVEGEQQYRKQIQEIIQSQKTLKAELEASEQGFAKETSAMDKSRAASENLQRQIANAETQLAKQNEMLDKAVEKYGADSKEANGFREAVAKTQIELGKLNEELRKSSGAVVFGKSMQEAGEKISKAGEKMTKVGSGLSKGLTLPLAAAGTAAVKLATDFETSIAKLNSIADTSTVSIEELESSLLQLSSETGIAATDLAEQAYQAISAGRDTADAVQFVGKATKLATSGFATTGDALDVLTTILNAYGMEASDVDDISDKLIQTQNLGKTSVGELSQTMGRAIPTAAAFGVDLDQLASAYVTLTKNGINTANSTTMINGLLNEIGKSGTKASNVLKQQTGKSFAELMASGMSLSDVLEIIDEDAKRNGLSLADMFGNVRAGQGALVIMNDEGQTFSETLEAMGTSAGTTDEAFAKVTDTAEYRFQKALNNVKNTGIDAGKSILTTLAPSLEKIGDAIKKACDWFSNLSDEQKDAIVKVALFAAALGPATTALGKMTSGVGSAVTGVGKLVEKLGMVGSIGPGGMVALAAAAGVAWYALNKMVDERALENAEWEKAVNNGNKEIAAAKNLNSEIQGQIATRQANASQMQGQATLAKSLADELQDLAQKESLTATEQDRVRTATAQLNAIYPEMALQIDEVTGNLTAESAARLDNVDAMIAEAKAAAAQEMLQEVSKQIVDAEVKRADVAKELAAAQEALAEAERKHAEAVDETETAELVRSYQELDKTVQGLTEQQTALDATLEELNAESDAYVDVLKSQTKEEKNAKSEAEKLDASLDGAGEAAEGAATDFSYLNEETDELGDTAEDTAGDVETAAEAMEKAYSEAYNSAKSSISGQTGLMKDLSYSTDLSLEGIRESYRKQTEFMTSYNSNLQKLLKYATDTQNAELLQYLQDHSEFNEENATLYALMVEDIEKGGQELQEVLKGYGAQQEAIDAVAEANAKLQTTEKTSIEKVKEEAKTGKKDILTIWEQMGVETPANFKKGLSPEEIKKAGSLPGAYARQGLVDSREETNKVAKNSGTQAGNSLKAGITGTRSDTNAAAAETGRQAGAKIVAGAKEEQENIEKTGQNLTLGLKKGMSDKETELYLKAQAIASNVVKTMNNTVQVQSPSRLTRETGRYLDEGLALGMLDRVNVIRNAAEQAAAAAIPDISRYADFGDRTAIDPDELYAAVMRGATDAQPQIYLNGRDLTRSLKGMGVAFSNG